MVLPELEKLKITEIKVRMDCNGCVQKIKRALYGINGIYDLYIDFPQQKLTLIGWADPEKIMKAIKKTKKMATICSHTDHTEPDAAQPSEPPPDQGTSPPAEAPKESPPPPQEPAPSEEPSEEPPKDAPPQDSLQPEKTLSPTPNQNEAAKQAEPSPAPAPGSKPAEVHVIHHHSPQYTYRPHYSSHWNKYQSSSSRVVAHEPPMAPPMEPPPVYVSHSYNTYKPPPYVTEYVRAPPQVKPSPYAGEYSEDYHSNGNNGNITALFSDENPNACSVM